MPLIFIVIIITIATGVKLWLSIVAEAIGFSLKINFTI